MKHYMIGILMLAALSMPSFAQESNKHCQQKGKDCKLECKQANPLSPEQMMEMGANKMAAELMLSDETKAKFTPLYKEYVQAMHKNCAGECKKDQKCSQPQAQKQLTDAEIDNMMNAKFKKDSEIAKLKETYYGKFRKILSAQQTLKVFNKNHMPKPGKFHKMGKRCQHGMQQPKFKKLQFRHPVADCPEAANK